MSWRLAITRLVLGVALISPLLQVEEFPFSNYPMYSNAQLNTRRLTIYIEEEDSGSRPITNDEIYPMKRIHLGYLLKEAREGNQIAKASVTRLLSNLPKRSQIGLITIAPGAVGGAPYRVTDFYKLPISEFVVSSADHGETNP